jgi:hypothetical protein
VKTPHTIDPNSVYTLEAARLALELTATTLKREVRLQQLRVSKRAGRYFLLGQWLLHRLRDGEVRRGCICIVTQKREG